MSSLTLSWDLFIVAFFAIMMSCSFIVGRHQSMKIILASYIAAIATQGLVSVTKDSLGTDMLISAGIPVDATMIALGKIFLFALCILIFVLRSGIEISYEKDTGSILTIVSTGLFGFSVSALIVSTILVYAAGTGVLSNSLLAGAGAASVATPSALMQLMIVHQNVWYTLPAFLIIIFGFLRGE